MDAKHRKARSRGRDAAGPSKTVQRVVAADGSEPNPPDLGLQREAERLHERGPRPIGELLAEIYSMLDADQAAHLRERIQRYNSIPTATYRALGGDRHPRRPFAVVDGGAR